MVTVAAVANVLVALMPLLSRGRLAERSRRRACKDVDQQSNDPGPSRLMAGAETGAVVTVKVFVEQQMIAPIGITLKFFGAPEHRPPAGLIAQEDPG
jgi:hypothetical protein